ncbi:hypothetical protein Golomagni_03454 [Golovinomyces magnicellulatus]|nr:hypothetical protein Golomagni_03454 [Golovinomyces magnicellulatus]
MTKRPFELSSLIAPSSPKPVTASNSWVSPEYFSLSSSSSSTTEIRDWCPREVGGLSFADFDFAFFDESEKPITTFLDLDPSRAGKSFDTDIARFRSEKSQECNDHELIIGPGK